MSEPIRIDINEDIRTYIAELKDYPVEMRKGIKRGMDKGGNIALGKITTERFTGHGPFAVEEHRLGVVTNRMRQSLRWAPAEIAENTITGNMGSNVKYFGPHEFGFDGDVQVKAFSRTVSPSQFVKPGTGLKKLARGKAARKEALGTEEVKAHSRHMHIPARAPLGHGIADHVTDFTDQIGAELLEVWMRKVGNS